MKPGFCLLAVLLSVVPCPGQGISFQTGDGTLRLSHAGAFIGDFVFRDERIGRPFFANLRTPDETQVTRTHPPRTGKDLEDHATMHPGLWLGFGDINGDDFWRNKARMEFDGFERKPAAQDGALRFTTRHRLVGNQGLPLGTLDSRVTLQEIPQAFLIIWDATCTAGNAGMVFGDQEEMGFGARLATPLIETNGGTITQSTGKKTAKGTWGQPADWTDYSGLTDGKPAGITLMASPGNFRKSWWHNRDYGLMVANPFGRQAMKQGAKSAVPLKPGETLRLTFGAALHQGKGYEPGKAYEAFLKATGTP
jgi:hypothetical protein